MDGTPIVTAIIAALSAIIVALISNLNSKKSGKKNSDDVIAEVKRLTGVVQELREDVNDLRQDVNSNNALTVADARAALESIYKKYCDKKAMPLSSWKAVEEIHDSYKRIRLPDGHIPNSWADGLFEGMKGWKKI